MTPRLLIPSLALLTLLCGARAAPASTPPVEDRVRDLLSRMTLEEKVGQLVQYSSPGEVTGPASMASLVPAMKAGGVGSMLNVHGAVTTRQWQKLAVESSRLHIPLLFGLDVIHG